MDHTEASRAPARVSVTVMAHKTRAHWAEQLARELDCPIVWDTTNTVWDTAKTAWRTRDPEATHHAVIQDDVQLTRNLRHALHDIVTARPNDLISLIAIEEKLKPEDLTRYEHAVREGHRWFPAYYGLPGCAVILPVHEIEPMIASGDRLSTPHDDQKIVRYFRKQRRPTWYVVPSLVQHRSQEENESIANAGRGWRPRVSLTFPGEHFDACTLDYIDRCTHSEPYLVGSQPVVRKRAGRGRRLCPHGTPLLRVCNDCPGKVARP